MTKEQKFWEKDGTRIAKEYPHVHPDRLIQSEWDRGFYFRSTEDFSTVYELFKFWAAGVRKGSTYYETH